MWYVLKFEKPDGSAIVAEYRFDATLSELQTLFHRPANDPLVLQFPITREQQAYFETKLGVQFDLDRYHYFLARYDD